MKVLFATHSTDRGSTSRTLEAWARLLPEYGIEPIVTIGGDGPLLSALRDTGVAVHVHPIRYWFSWTRPQAFLGAIWKLARRIRSSGAKLVHVNEHEHYQVPAHAARLAGVPVVAHIRFKPEAAMAQWLFKPPYTPQRVFFTSGTQMRDCGDNVATAVPRERFTLLYNGLDLRAFGQDRGARARLRAAWGLEPDTVAIGTASSISARKRLDHFVQAIANLLRAGIKVRGYIAGQPYFPEDEAELARLRALVASLGLDDSVTFLGYVEPAEPLYHAWDLCVSTSEYETFGMTVLEAMACGCPVVAYPGGSIAEVIGNAAPLVADADIGQLTAALAALAADGDARREAADLARGRAAAFDVRNSILRLADEYRAVLDAAGAPLDRRRN